MDTCNYIVHYCLPTACFQKNLPTIRQTEIVDQALAN